MEPFLQQVARYLVRTFPDHHDSVCVVLPNRRAGLFFRRYLAEARKPEISWSPALLSVEDFFVTLSGLQPVDDLTLLFELFRVYADLDESHRKDLSEFIRWAPQLLQDFNDIDLNMVDSFSIFRSLSEARAMSVWNVDGRPLSAFQADYLQFFQSLGACHQEWSSRLARANIASGGMIFRYVADHIESIQDNLSWQHVIFAGFNALNKAEEKVIGSLRREGRATLLWDADRYYIQNPLQEAGTFLRESFHRWPVNEVRWLQEDLSGSEKEITIAALPDAHLQARYCGTVLRRLAAEGQVSENTAVVLMDQSLLIPVLSAVPEEITDINVTAGFPLQQAPLNGFFEDLFAMHTGAERYANVSSQRNHLFHYSAVLKLLTNPYTRLLAEGNMNKSTAPLEDLIKSIRFGSSVYISPGEIIGEKAGLFGQPLAFLKPLFEPWSDYQRALGLLRQISELFPAAVSLLDEKLDEYSFELEYASAFLDLFRQLETSLQPAGSDMTIPLLRDIFRQMVSQRNLPFSGEPLKGLQIMGMLETRTLDFSNVIMLSCNDDLLPGTPRHTSFIPHDIRQAFGLPLTHQKDAVQAYHFYRLLQKASRIWLLYNTKTDILGGGEQSRFLRQIKQELPNANPGIRIREEVVSVPIPDAGLPPPITVEKDQAAINLLREKARKGYAPSALNIYRSCPLKFWYSEIARIREPEEMTDTIDPAILGQTVHLTLETLYRPLKGKILTSGLLDQIIPRVEQTVLSSFEHKIKGIGAMTGRNLLLANVAKWLVSAMIRYDKQLCEEQSAEKIKRTILYLEEPVDTFLRVTLADEQLDLRVKGIIDRVESENGCRKIIDYKTGTAAAGSLKVSEWEQLAGEHKLDMAFQLLTYSFLLTCKYPEIITLKAGVIPLKSISKGMINLEVPATNGNKNPENLPSGWIEGFRPVLQGLVDEINDVTIPFVQTNNPKNCRNCPYLSICGR